MVRSVVQAPLIGWRYLSNATCLTRPRLFYALFRRVKGHYYIMIMIIMIIGIIVI